MITSHVQAFRGTPDKEDLVIDTAALRENVIHGSSAAVRQRKVGTDGGREHRGKSRGKGA